ncbi:MAG: hypothetical protein CMO38_03580 [Verrucomicrobiaceae bacterium]|nr:hypothetical protein [Verrucomicrobiaceae bacterium]
MLKKDKISFYGKHLPKAGLTSLLLNKGAATHFITYESHFVGSAAITQIIKWSSVAVAGLGTYDAVSGATQITQISPSSGSSTVPAKAGELLNLVYQITGAPHRPKSWEVSGQIPPGVTHLDRKNSNTDGLTGIPTNPGTYKVFVTAYKGSNLNGYSYTKTFTIEVTPGSEPPVISNQPSDITISSVNETTLEVGVTGEGINYQWYKGESGVTSTPVNGANNKFLKVGPLKTDSNYWVQISNDAGTINSRTTKIKVVDNYTSWAQQFGLNSPLSDPTKDNDEDGLTNEFEYLIGSSPLEQSLDANTEILIEGSEIKLSFLTKAAAGNGYAGLERVYSIEESDNISKDSWKPVQGYQNIIGNGQKISITNPLNDGKKYYRLKIHIREKS